MFTRKLINKSIVLKTPTSVLVWSGFSFETEEVLTYMYPRMHKEEN